VREEQVLQFLETAKSIRVVEFLAFKGSHFEILVVITTESEARSPDDEV
jgi:hypothetical protein